MHNQGRQISSDSNDKQFFTFTIASSILLVTLLFSAYSNTFHSPPILDDLHSFVTEQKVYINTITFSKLFSLSETVFGWRRWIPMVTFALNYWFGGSDITMFHLTNITIHMLCMLSVLWLVFQLIELQRKTGLAPSTLRPIQLAAVIAGAWALHPVQTNAVTYLVQRMASIQALFYITSVACYIKGRMAINQPNRSRRALVYYVVCALSGIGAFLSKENSAMLPIMILITEAWFFHKDLPSLLWTRFKNSHWSIKASVLLAILLLSVFSFRLLAHIAACYSGRHFTMAERLLTEARVMVWYVSILIWPAPSRLSIEHDVIISTSMVSPPTTLLAILLIFSSTWLTLRLRHRYPLITYGFMWYIINLLIESSIAPLELIFEHRLYLPSVGIFLIIVIGLTEGFRKILPKMLERDFAKLSLCIFALFLSSLTLMTFIRNQVWRDVVSIYQDAAQKAPLNPRAHANLAVALFSADRYHEAAQEAEIAIKLGKDKFEEFAVASNVIVNALLAQRKAEEAIRRGEELLSLRPKHLKGTALPNFCLSLSSACRVSSHLKGALSAAFLALEYVQRTSNSTFKKKLVISELQAILADAVGKGIDLNGDGHPDPGTVPIQTWIAKELLDRGERGEAELLLNQALAENPQDQESRRLLMVMHREEELNRIQKSKWNFSQKYVQRPFSLFNTYMAAAYLIKEKKMLSVFTPIGERFIDLALKLHPNSSDAHLLRGWYHYEKGHWDEAVLAAMKALTLDGNNAKAWLGLAFFQAEANQPQEAIRAFHKTLELYPGYSRRLAILDIISDLQSKCFSCS